ncbi:MAG: hypothetical protein EOP84_11625 [Verrucomicrobiaceae bacterium]|nr:MAG: hypothetical protein EOP84_11625 [Verrucomicrobiaceae bacterium]
MPAEAHIAPIWKKQKLFVAVFFLALGGWFWWDGLVGYPRSNERWNAYQQHKTEGREKEWPEYAKKQGWIAKPPKELHTREDILGQYVFGGICDILGLVLFVYWATQIRRTLRTDEEAVYTSSGTRVPFTAITGVGKKHWDSKGIAKVRYELGGRQGQFIVDDYKFDTEPTRQILQEIEDHLLNRKPSPEAKP